MPLERPRPAPGAIDTGHEGDDEQLRLLAGEAPLSVPRHWTHYLFCADRAAAERLAQELSAGWETTVGPTPDATGFWVSAHRDQATVSAREVRLTRAELTALAARFGGEYDGWRAWM